MSFEEIPKDIPSSISKKLHTSLEDLRSKLHQEVKEAFIAIFNKDTRLNIYHHQAKQVEGRIGFFRHIALQGQL